VQRKDRPVFLADDGGCEGADAVVVRWVPVASGPIRVDENEVVDVPVDQVEDLGGGLAGAALMPAALRPASRHLADPLLARARRAVSHPCGEGDAASVQFQPQVSVSFGPLVALPSVEK
jgi:hypothetical protein